MSTQKMANPTKTQKLATAKYHAKMARIYRQFGQTKNAKAAEKASKIIDRRIAREKGGA